MKISISLWPPVQSYIGNLNKLGYAQLKWDSENFETTGFFSSYNFTRIEWVTEDISFNNVEYMEIYKYTSPGS